MTAPAWLLREQTDEERKRTRYREQFKVDATFIFEPSFQHERAGQLVAVVRAPRLDVKNASVRVQFQDGEQLTVRPGALQRPQRNVFTRPPTPALPPAPPGREGRALEYPAEPPAPVTAVALHRLSQEARAEINRIAQAIHRRYFVAPPRPEREGRTPSQPKRDETSADVRENWLGSYSDALEACRHLQAGHWETAAGYAALALDQQRRYRDASRRYEEVHTRLSTGRYFDAELLSVRAYAPNNDPNLHAAFEQWYVRLVLIWAEDGVTLRVANGRQLEGESGIEVGEYGWSDLARWIHDLTEVQDGRRAGRRMDNDETLIYQHDDWDGYRLRRRLHRDYPNLPRAFEALRRAMHETRTLDPDELPDDRPAIGYHPPIPRDDRVPDDAIITDDELALLND